jgi:peptidyl-prolyl cis-trans isomerase C
MKQRKRFFASLVVALSASVAAGCSCKKQPAGFEGAGSEKGAGAAHGLTAEQASRVLVKVGDRTITVGEFADRLADQSPYLRARFQSPERRREFLNNMVRFELLSLEAEKRGYDKSPQVQKIRDQKMVQQMMKKLFDEGGEKISDIKEEEIKAYYDQNREEYHKPEQVRASHILFKNRQQAQKVLKQLQAASGDVRLFRELAGKESLDEKTRERGGDLRFFSRPSERTANEPEVPDAVREAAFSIEKKGGVYPSVVASEQGFHIVQLTDRRKAYDRSLEEARRSIQNRLWRERREKAIDAFVQQLREKAKVEEHPELLDQIRVDFPQDEEASPKGKSAPGPWPAPAAMGAMPAPPGDGR